jgi:hypothetical protein
MTEHPTLDRLWSEFLAAAMIVFCTAIGGLVAHFGG